MTTKIPVELSSTPGIVDGSNATAITIDSSENVGIGTTSPNAYSNVTTLTINGTNQGRVDLEYGGTLSGSFLALSGQTQIKASGGSQVMVFEVNDAERMRVDTSGNVGIGTSSPSADLHISGDQSRTCIIERNVGSEAVNLAEMLTHQALTIFNKTGGSYLNFAGNASGSQIQAQSNGSTAEDIALNPYGGNVGIGTSSPATTLAVAGSNVNDDSPTIRLTNTLSSGSWQSISGDMGRLEFFTEDASGVAPYVIGRITANNDALSGSRTLPSGALNFFTRGYNDSSLTLAMTLSSGGALSKSSGSFKIDHPLESKKDTHHLVHSFVEAPQADNIYRGVVVLENGTATINLDTVSGMSEGTYVLLNTNTSCFTSNETDWDAVKGSVSGNILTISCQNTSSTATVSWLVIGERHDQHMKDTDWTDSDGKVIVEPTK